MGRAAFDEMKGPPGPAPPSVRSAYHALKRWLDETPAEVFDARRSQAELFFRRIGITFAVYGDNESTERLIPFDIIPRVLTMAEWVDLERGLKQRVTALNAFLADVYGPQECIKAGIVPADLVYRNPYYRPEMIGFEVPHGDLRPHRRHRPRPGRRCHLLRARGQCPHPLRRLLHAREPRGDDAPLPGALRAPPGRSGRELPGRAARDLALGRARARASRDPTAVLLTPGRFNSAFYEHSFLADKLGVELVEASDLFVKDDVVFMRTTEGPQRVDVIYRRIDDDFSTRSSSGRIPCSGCRA